MRAYCVLHAGILASRVLILWALEQTATSAPGT